MGLCEIDLSFAGLLILASRVKLQHEYQALRGSLHYHLLAFTGCLSTVEEVDAHVEAPEQFVDEPCHLSLLDLDHVHEPS